MSKATSARPIHHAEKYGFVILEDDYDYDFHYRSAPILPLASVYKQGPVIYSGSFSKLLAPSVRLGYLVAPQAVVAEINKLRHILDRQGDPVVEKALAQMLAEGEVQRHLKKVVKIYKQRRDYFCNLLKTELSNYLKFQIPEGGMAIWTTVLQKQNEQEFSSQLLKKGLYLNMDKHFLSEHNALRMGFASINEKEMEELVAVLKEVFECGKARSFKQDEWE